MKICQQIHLAVPHKIHLKAPRASTAYRININAKKLYQYHFHAVLRLPYKLTHTQKKTSQKLKEARKSHTDTPKENIFTRHPSFLIKKLKKIKQQVFKQKYYFRIVSSMKAKQCTRASPVRFHCQFSCHITCDPQIRISYLQNFACSSFKRFSRSQSCHIELLLPPHAVPNRVSRRIIAILYIHRASH